MSEVSCRVCEPILDAVLARGGSAEALVEGLSFDAEDLRVPSNRVSWDDYAVFLERAARAMGGPASLERLGAEHRGDPAVGLLKLLARRFGARPTYQLGAKWYGPSLFSCTRATCEDLPGGRIRQTVEILPPHRHSPEFFEMMGGFLRATPALIGLPHAVVEAEVSPGRAVYTITPPKAVKVTEHLRRLLGWRDTSRQDAIAELSFQQHQLGDALARARRNGLELEEKSRKLETINRLGRELTRETDVSRLADAAMRVFGDHFRFARIDLWQVPAAGGDFELLHRVGAAEGEPSRRHLLEAGSRSVGRLDVWEGARAGESTTPLFEDLFPWLALALDNARTFTALQRQTERLVREMDERRRAEERLHQAQKMDAVGRLAGGLAHDLNNTLTAIRGYAELARESLPAGAAAGEDIDEIVAEGEKASGTIAQLLAMSRRQMRMPERVDPSRMVLGMERMLERLLGETISLEVRAAADAGLVVADPGQLEQTIVNLVMNSRDAMPAGGTITVETRRIASEGGDRVCLEVRDDGVGMDDATRRRIFEPFFTTKPRGQGTGLGLSAVYGIVAESDGTIDVESEPGRGTAIRIELPRVDGASQPARESGAEDLAPGGRETLLLVEDEHSVRTVTRRLLEQRGYRVLEAGDGKAALDIATAHRGPIDLVVTDVVMPVLDGRELAIRLARERPEIRGVIYVSGHANGDAGSGGSAAAEKTFLRKPFSPQALLRAIRTALDAGSHAASSG